MTAPKPGSRYRDKEANRICVFLGDNGHGPMWQYEGERDWWYCDWCDFYLWNRFEAI